MGRETQLPAYAPVPEWTKISGVSRSSTYRLLAEGKLQARKLGRSTLIDVRAGISYLDTLPASHGAEAVQ